MTIAKSLPEYFELFSDFFKITKHSYERHAFDYLGGLFKLEKKQANCQEIADCISSRNQQSINHFINSDKWSYRSLMDEIAQQASEIFQASETPVALLIDEVGFRKKGRHSACCSRQYLGCIGKVDNGQVAVVAGLSQHQNYAPIDARLFIPKDWEVDEQRREKCRIPSDSRHKSKPELAIEAIKHATQNKINFDYVNVDALYGNAAPLLEFLIDEGIKFIGDVRVNQKVYFDYDKSENMSVKDYEASLSDDDFEEMIIRKSTKGLLKARFHHVKVQVYSHNRWLDLILIIRKDHEGATKFSLCNMHEMHIWDIVQAQGQRIFIEQLFKEAKNLLGMGDYQLRSWTGFHNHMVICMLAMLLIAKVKVEYKSDILTSVTIKKLICSFIYSKMNDPDLAIQLIFKQYNRYLHQLEIQGFFEDDS